MTLISDFSLFGLIRLFEGSGNRTLLNEGTGSVQLQLTWRRCRRIGPMGHDGWTVSLGFDYDEWGNMTHRYGWGGELQGGTAGQSSDIYYTYTNNRRKRLQL